MVCDWPIRVKSKDGSFYNVPCGTCPPCRKGRVDDWVFRLQYEERRSISAYFVTLTYDNAHVPITPNGYLTLYRKDPAPKKYVDDLTKPYFDKKGKKRYKKKVNPTWKEFDRLNPGYLRKDIPSFVKRLRKTQRDKSNRIKYYACGEYGTDNFRPHYHLIMFNVDTLVIPIGEDSKGYKKYHSPSMAKAWPFGKIDIGTVSADSIAYTCKYMHKPGRIPAHKNDDRLKEFSIMSKGLGDNYLTPHVLKYHSADLSRNYLLQPGAYKKRLPRFYRERVYSETERALQNRFIIQDQQEKYDKIVSDLRSAYGDDFDVDNYLLEQKKARLRLFWSKVKRRK